MEIEQRIQVEVHFKPALSGGRTTPVQLTTGSYRPHLVTDSNELLGAVFVDAVMPVAQPGDTTCATVALMYPGVNYSSLMPGAAFKIVEGTTVVDTGKVCHPR